MQEVKAALNYETPMYVQEAGKRSVVYPVYRDALKNYCGTATIVWDSLSLRSPLATATTPPMNSLCHDLLAYSALSPSLSRHTAVRMHSLQN